MYSLASETLHTPGRRYLSFSFVTVRNRLVRDIVCGGRVKVACIQGEGRYWCRGWPLSYVLRVLADVFLI